MCNNETTENVHKRWDMYLKEKAAPFLVAISG